ncbi:MAG: hypothetical protein HC834_09805, partial [Rhodospirillales bacterium]|nr:hypothetical protein [Rhodospirillales bacterium]
MASFCNGLEVPTAAAACRPEEAVEACIAPAANAFCLAFGQARCATETCAQTAEDRRALAGPCYHAQALLKNASALLTGLGGVGDLGWYREQIRAYDEHTLQLMSLQGGSAVSVVILHTGASQTCIGSACIDRDGDGIVDADDQCPTVAGDPRYYGCPKRITITSQRIEILEAIHFAANKDVILPQSVPVLQAVTAAIQTVPAETRIAIEGHTDDRGDPFANQRLSARRPNASRNGSSTTACLLRAWNHTATAQPVRGAKTIPRPVEPSIVGSTFVCSRRLKAANRSPSCRR